MTPIFECGPPCLVVTIHLPRRHHQRLSLGTQPRAFAPIGLVILAPNSIQSLGVANPTSTQRVRPQTNISRRHIGIASHHGQRYVSSKHNPFRITLLHTDRPLWLRLPILYHASQFHATSASSRSWRRARRVLATEAVPTVSMTAATSVSRHSIKSHDSSPSCGADTIWPSRAPPRRSSRSGRR